MKQEKLKWIAKGIFFGGLFFVAVTLGTQWLWNNLAVDIFSVKPVTLFQALGLLLLGRILTGGFGKRGGHWGGGMWHKRKFMKEKWEQMSEEERNQFMGKWGGGRCGPWGKHAPASEV